MTATAFDVLGPLPQGTGILEASAGTGKTYTIAALAARYLAEGVVDLRELLIVTFSRAATAELRQRVRERLVSAERGLADPEAARRSGDGVLTLLADAPDEEVARRRDRLTVAVSDFDAATVATTHQFCRQALAGLGIVAGTDPDAVFVDDLDDVVTEVVDDLYIRKYAAADAPVPAFTRATALTIARQAVAHGQARLEPAGDTPGSEADTRYRFARAVCAEVDHRKRARRLFCFDDMLTGLADALTDPVRGPAARRRLRDRYRVVLIDEFQDTDPVQWTILRTAFHDHATLVLIGDPKQAVYAFRGADVASYLAASGDAPAHATLATNWRSDAGVLSALETVFGRAALGDQRITVRPVAAAHAEARMTGPPFRLRVLSRDGQPLNKSGLIPAPQAREAIADDLAGQVGAMLTGSPVAPGDIAVLVRTHRQSLQVHQALTRAGLPAVVTGTTSVFGTDAAQEWLVLLDALEQPHRPTRVAAAALTGLVGWSADRLAVATDQQLDELSTTLRHWARLVATRGVAALLEAVTATGLPARQLSRRSGERHLTDLRHVGMAMHAAAVDGGLGLASVTAWLRRRIADAPDDAGAERSRRLESDADAVQILTVHVSKGLEFPVVFLPFGWDRYPREPDLPLLHDDAGDRVLDVGGRTGPDFARHSRRHQAEDDGEDLRLLYVALTRAASRIVAWWAPTASTPASALHRFLFGRPGDATDPLPRYGVPADAAALTHLRGLPHLDVEAVSPAAPITWTPPGTAPPALAAATFTRTLDTGWRRTSYSRITAGTHDGPDLDAEADEPAVTVAGEPEPSAMDLPSPMAALPGGAAFGTLVHTLLEGCDFTATDLPGQLTARASELLGPAPAGVTAAELAAGLLPALHTPLGPLAGQRALVTFATTDRLDELDFELPLGGGDRPGEAAISVGDIADCLDRHADPAGPLAGYADRLRSAELGPQVLRGYLAGSIDAVLRLPGPRYMIVDYKTNRLGVPTEPLTSRHYRPQALAQAMMAAHYPLQALLYATALHRYLRWRQPGYQVAEHFGGVLYLFLRGMCGPAGGTSGVFDWQPPPRLIEDLSDLFDGGRS